MKKIITVVGARPQFVKAAVVSRALRQAGDITEIIVHTGQHFDANMSEVFFDEMEIPQPQYNLNVNSMTHGKMTGKMMEMLDEIVIKEKPDAVLLYGDTNSTLAGALIASKLHVPVGHVEAGLRSFNMRMPEEINRILTDRVSKWLFCPTPTAVKNLKNEGYDNINAEIHMTGDVMYDAALYYAGLLDKRPTRLNLKEKEFILATIHREENTHHPDNLKRVTGILNWLNKLVPVVMPVHPGTAARFRQNAITPEFTMIDPAGYFDMIRLLQGCSFVVTDSGGLQKEASFFNKFCLTLREQTEWVELVENGVNFVAGTNEEKVKGYTEKIRGMKFPENLQLYGDGNAGEKITKILSDSL